jgi:hypothetical protein
MADLMSKLKKKYDSKKITQVENDVDSFRKASNSAEKNMVETLYYLDSTERFKENATYKNSTFKAYISDRFCITLKKYFDMRKAYHYYNDDAIKYGCGLITSISRRCGKDNVSLVLEEMNREDSKTKGPISRSRIEKVIEKYEKAKPIPKLPDINDDTNWKLKYETERDARIAAEKELVAAKEQIARLKGTVLRLKAAQSAIEQAATAFRDTENIKHMPS